VVPQSKFDLHHCGQKQPGITIAPAPRERVMFGMMQNGVMNGPMTWGMGVGMGLFVVVLVLGVIVLGKYIFSRSR
jgi:hypothetical protein